MGAATIYTGADAWVQSTLPAANFSTGPRDRILAPGTSTKYTFIRCNNPVPRNAVVTSAKLHLYGYSNWGAGAVTVTIQRVSSKWTESGITYNNRPGVTGSAVSVTQTNTVDGTEWIFDLTALWQLIVSGGTNYGWRISTTSTTEHRFHGYQAAEFRPVWEFEWSDAPDAPTELSPAGGASVTLQRPVLSMNFHDVSGSTAMAGLRVQFKSTSTGWTADSATGGFAAPDWDSGQQSTSDPELDTATAVSAISATVWPGLAVGGSVWWTTQVKDGAGIWSEWSDPVSFNRVARGALTLNSPTGGVINDSTQTVIWTLTGATQTAWRVMIADDANPTKLLYDTGRKSGTETSWTIPKNIITDESTSYRLTVRTWDDLSRTATPGDTIHTEVVATFTFSSTGTADPITGMLLTPRDNNAPGMWIEWDRASAPDYYEIRRGTPGSMIVVETNIDPVDVLDSGTHYKYLDKTATPYSSHTWRVVAKTIGAASKFGPTITGEFTIETTWLEDVDTGKLVPILYPRGAEELGGLSEPQISSIAQPNSGSKIVRMAQGQAGLQGSVSGVLIDYGGSTATTWRKNLEWMRDRPENTLRLSVRGVNLKVIIGDVVIAPFTKKLTGSRLVQFNFWEQ